MSSLPQVMKEPGGRTFDDVGDYSHKQVFDEDDDENYDDKNSLLSFRLPRRPGRLRVPRCKPSGRGMSETCQPDNLKILIMIQPMNKFILVLGGKFKDPDLSDVSDVPDIKTVVVVDNADSGILLII